MPEAPDLQVVKEFLARRLTGVAVTEARVLRPTVLRVLAAPHPTSPPTSPGGASTASGVGASSWAWSSPTTGSW